MDLGIFNYASKAGEGILAIYALCVIVGVVILIKYLVDIYIFKKHQTNVRIYRNLGTVQTI
jgi:hypothetical protein